VCRDRISEVQIDNYMYTMHSTILCNILFW